MKKTINRTKKKLAYLVLFLFLMSLQGFGQMISQSPSDYPSGATFSSCPGGSCVISLPPARFNQNYQITIPLTATATTHVFSLSSISGSCTAINSNHTLTNTVNVIDFLVTERCGTGISNSLSFTMNVNDGVNPPEQQNFIIPIIRDTVKVVLTLDISGSMSLPVQSGTGTRIDALKTAVNGLVPKLEDFKQAGDSLGVTYFSSNVIQPNTPISDGFILIDETPGWPNTSAGIVYTDMNPRTPLQMTALGEGLLDAKNKLSLDNSPNLKRLVFLFTDGLQNYGNQVKLDGNSFQSSTDSLNNYSTNPKDSIQYFPVATWAAGDHPELLQNIADGSDGEVLFVTPGAGLTSWFNNQLVNMLDEGSPQIVSEKTLNGISEEYVHSFFLNELVNTLLIELVAKDSLNLSIIKDGKDISSKAKVTKGNGFSLLSFNFPFTIDTTVINSGGEWQVIIKDETPNPLSLAVIADDHYLNYDCGVNKNLYTVGDTIFFKSNLSHLGTPISGAGNSVTAVLLKPGEDLGHLLSSYETPDMDSTIDSGSGASQKFNELFLNDTAFYNALLPKEQVIVLTEVGNGEFTGSFENTDLAGIYNIIFLVNGEIPDFGKFQRTKTISTVFVFGQVVEETPEVVDVPPASTGGHSKYTVLLIKPKNKFGKYMGPGFQSRIKVSVNSKPIHFYRMASTQISTHKGSTTEPYIEKIEDMLDGSYLIHIANVSTEDNPDISISVRGESLYEGKLKPVPIWFYIIVIIIVLIILLIQKNKSNPKFYKVLLWILLLICILIYVLHRFGILFIL